MEFKNKNCLITGASKGLGYAIAEVFVKNGASVLICSRNLKQIDKAVSRLERLKLYSGQVVSGEKCDMSENSEVDLMVDNFVNRFKAIDILINNAGVYGPFGNIEKINWDEWLKAIQINLFGPIYITRALIPHFRKETKGKIINISGGGATSPMPGLSSYAVAKAGLVRFTETLAHELRLANIDVNSVAPGALATRLLDQVIKEGGNKLNKKFIDRMIEIKKNGGTSLQVASSCILNMASKDFDGITGKLISAVWDDWDKINENKNVLANSDIYTLRRITASDRGEKWGDREKPRG